jgi:predicted aspartyl protease
MFRYQRQTAAYACLFLGLICGPSVSRAEPSSSTFAASSPVSGTVAGRLIAGYLLVVPISVNGRGPWEFVVDTGTNQTVLDPALARELRLTTTGRVTLNTLAGPQQTAVAAVDAISAGGLAVEKIEILVGELDAVRALDGRVRGVLGLDFLYHFAFSLNYERARLRLFPANLLADPEDSDLTSVDVRLVDGRLLVPASWQGGGERLLALDSGIADVLLFDERKESMRPTSADESRQMLVTNSTATHAASISLSDFMIGPLRLQGLHGLRLIRTDEMKDLREDGLLPARLFRVVFVNAHARIAAFKEK